MRDDPEDILIEFINIMAEDYIKRNYTDCGVKFDEATTWDSIVGRYRLVAERLKGYDTLSERLDICEKALEAITASRYGAVIAYCEDRGIEMIGGWQQIYKRIAEAAMEERTLTDN